MCYAMFCKTLMFKSNVALGGASLAAEERGGAKPRGRGRGQRNTTNHTSKHNYFYNFAVHGQSYERTFLQLCSCHNKLFE